MPRHSEGGLRSDGELVQALDDRFEFALPRETSGLLLPAVQSVRAGSSTGSRDADPADGIEGDGDGDDDLGGLPDTIIWCINGEAVEDAGLGELLLL